MEIMVKSMHWRSRSGGFMSNNDFMRDFRYGDERDDRDNPFCNTYGHVEFSDCNRNSLFQSFSKVKDRAKAILEYVDDSNILA